MDHKLISSLYRGGDLISVLKQPALNDMVLDRSLKADRLQCLAEDRYKPQSVRRARCDHHPEPRSLLPGAGRARARLAKISPQRDVGRPDHQCRLFSGKPLPVKRRIRGGIVIEEAGNFGPASVQPVYEKTLCVLLQRRQITVPRLIAVHQDRVRPFPLHKAKKAAGAFF